MTCTKCGNDTKVIDTCHLAESVTRKRKCKSCDYVFFTEELKVKEGVAIPNRHQMRHYVRHR
jgi:transcriptional regulator NrdR family protein